MGKRTKKTLSLLLALIMVLSMVQLDAFAAQAEHVHNDGGWTCVQAEGTRQLVCEVTEHTHGEECFTAGEPVLTCGLEESEAHEHTEECRGEAPLTCEEESEEHEHTEDCYGEAPLTCGKEESEGHAHSEDCYTAGKPVLTCEAAEHTHTEECYTVTEGAWTCTAPVAETPAEVQAFLDAVAAIPADINADNAAEVGAYVYGEVADAYALLGTEYAERADVQEAAAVWTAAVEAVQAALDMGNNIYGANGTIYSDSIFGFGSVICYDPRDSKEFPKSDNTQISVIPWNFNNSMHARDYYYDYDYRIGGKRTDPDPNPVQDSYFERTYRWDGLDWFEPLTFNKAAAPGSTGSLHWTQGEHNSDSGFTEIPSVFLYRLEEVTGSQYIDGGLDGITFHADDQTQLESSGGPVYNNTCPHIRVDVPIKEDAPEDAVVEVRFRLAMGYDMAWQPIGSAQSRWKDTYFWYVQDFILNLTVGESGGTTPEVPTADVTKYHDLYIPAGEYSAVMSFSEIYYGYSTNYCTLSDNSYVQGDEAVASITGSELVPMNNTSTRKTYNDVTITSAKDAQVGDTTTLYATYTATSPYGALDGQETCLDVITVHIIEPREVQLDINGTQTVNTLGKSADGTLSTNGTVFRFNEGSTSIVTGQNNKSTQTMTLTGVSDGTAVIERQYHYYRNNRSTGYSDYLTTYVDVVNVTVGTPKGDDPDSIDGLSITKKVNKTTAVGGDELEYTITVTNDSSVDKPVTVTDSLPYGTTFVSSDSTEGATHDGNGNVTWKPTVPAKGQATLTIVVKIADGAYGTLRNVANLTSGNNDTKQAYVETAVTPKSTPTYNLVVNKTMAESTNAAGDDIVTFTVTVENKSNVSLYNLMLVDTMDKTLEPTQDMDEVQVTITGNDGNTKAAFMGARDNVKAPERDSNGHIVWTDEGGLTRTDDGEDKWDFTWMLEGEFKPNATVTLTYSARIIYPEDADSVAYYNYADAIAGAEEDDVPQYDGSEVALFGFVSGGSGGVGGSVGGGSGAVGETRYKYTLTYDFTGGTWTQGDTTHNNTYTVEKWSKNDYCIFTVDGSVRPEKDGYTFQNKWTEGGTTYYAGGQAIATSANKNVTIYAMWEKEPSVTVTWVDENGDELYKMENVKPGEVPEANEYETLSLKQNPTKADDENNTYTFAGWGESTDAEGNVTYTAQYTPTPKTPDTPDDPEKVTITIQYVDEDGNVVGTKEVEVEKDKSYNVTGDINSNVPEGYEVKEMPKDATGTANEKKTVTVTVVAEAWTVWVNHGNALNGTPTLAWMKGHVAANQYANTDAANHTRFYAPTNALPCLNTDYTFDHWALNYGDDGEPFVTGTYLVEQDNGKLLELHNVWIYDAVFLGHKDITVEKIFDGEGLTENDLPENFTLTYNNGQQTLTAAAATKFTTADGKPGYRWTLNAEVLTYYDWTYCFLEEANIDIEGYTLSGTTGGNTDENGKRYFPVRLISYDNVHSVEEMMNAPGIEQTFTITNSYTKNPVVTITIQYVDEDGNAVGTETVEVEKNSEYDVTGAINSNLPGGYEIKTMPDDATGTANESKTVTVVVKKTTTPENPDPVNPDPVIPGPVTGSYTLTIYYVDENGNTVAATYTVRLPEGAAYSVNSPAVEGYTPDQAVVSGVMRFGGVTVTVAYTADEADIEDDNPPLADLPDLGDDTPDADLPRENEETPDGEEDITDEDVPLSNVPKTGDHTNRFLVMAAVSGLCLLTLLSGRRKEDEA